MVAYIVIPVHNRKDITLNCLAKLRENGDLDRFQFVIVDDGSTDGTSEAVQSNFPEATVLTGNGDLWWTGAVAMGMKHACDAGAEYIIWLNDDCIPKKDTLPKLETFLRSHPNTIAAPACYQKGDLKPTVSGFKGRKSLKPHSKEDIIEVDGLCGWCVGMPASIVEHIGLPNAFRFPHYSGDDSYTLRATRSGFKAFILGDLKVLLDGEPYHGRDFSEYITFCDSHNKALKSLRKIFWNKKSPYRIPTMFFYQVERYGWLIGLVLFQAKLFNWFFLWIKSQIKVFPNS